MNRTEWMRGEIAAWRQAGVVDEATAARLLARYPQEVGRVSTGVLIAGLFGALMVGLGVIALFAANWAAFGRPLRAAIAMMPIAVCGIVTLVAAKREVKSRTCWEPLGIFWCLAVGAAACLVAQTYQVGGTASKLLLLVMLLSLPIGWVTKSVAVLALWPLYPVVWTFLRCEEVAASSHPDAVFAGFSLIALSLPGYIAFLRSKPSRGALVTAQLVTGFVYTVGPALMLLCCGYGGCRLMPIVLTYWMFSLPVVGFGLWYRLPVWPLVGTLVACALGFTSPFAESREFLLYPLSLALGVGVTAVGVVCAKLRYVNLGAVLLLWLVLVKFFLSGASFTVKGLLLIVCGAMLTTVNVIYIRRKRAERRVA